MDPVSGAQVEDREGPTGMVGWKGESLLLYANKEWTPPADKLLRIRMLTLPCDIVVLIDDFDLGKY
jgi:hypothetical protein